MRALCLGEALVDLVCQRPVAVDSPTAGLEEADCLTPHVGGVMANVALTAASLGADVSLAGGAGDDPWGHWLAGRLRGGGVGLDLFDLGAGRSTAVAFVTVDGAGEPRYTRHAEELDVTLAALAPRLEEVVEDAGVLCLGSNTLVGEADRRVTLAARERALEIGRPVVFDPNLRPGRWEHPGRAAAVARECIPGALLVKLNGVEARALSGEADPERAAAGLLAAGARNVVVTLGGQGALLRGEVRADAAGPAARVLNAAGAGDVLLGVILAALVLTDCYPPAIAAVLSDAVAAAARATEGWGALG